MPELQAYICLRLITAFLLLLCVYTIIGDTGWQQNEVVHNITMIKDHPKTSNDSKGKSRGFLKVLQSREIMGFAHFLADILTVLSRLSKCFQSRQLTIGEVPKLVSGTVLALRKLTTRPGPNTRKIAQSPGKYQGIDLTGEPPSQEHLVECIENIALCLEGRFAKELHDQTEAAATLLDFSSWPLVEETDFGDKEVTHLVDEYKVVLEKAGYDSNLIELEWDLAKKATYKHFTPVSKATWKAVSDRLAGECPNFFGMVDLLLSLPATSVECERGFSLMKLNEDCFSNDTDACEPGYHLNHENTPCHNDRKCCYCPPNTYQPWWNECVSCILCTNCSEMQKVTMHHCNITHNSVCGKHLVTTNVPEAEGTSIIPSTTQVSSHAITPEDEVVSNKLPEASDGTKEDEDEDDEQEGTVYRFWCVNYTLAHFFTHLLCLLPGVLFIAFPSWPRDINIAIKSSYNKWKRHYYRNSGHRPNRGSGLYNPPQGN